MRAQSVSSGAGSDVTGGDRGLQGVRPEHAAESLGPLKRGQTAADEDLIPARAILIQQQDGLARGPGPRARARGLDLHQSDQAVDLRLLRNQLGQDAAETERLFAERRSHPVLPGGRRVTLVEHQVDDLEDRREAGGELGPRWDLEGDAGHGEGALGPDDSLGDRRFRDQKGASDLFGLETAEQAERERDPGLGGEHRMAGDENQPQKVVADVLAEGGLQVRLDSLLLACDLVTKVLESALEPFSPAEEIDRTMFGGGHEPGTRVARDA